VFRGAVKKRTQSSSARSRIQARRRPFFGEVVELLKLQVEDTNWDDPYDILFKGLTASHVLGDKLGLRELAPKSLALIEERLHNPPERDPHAYLTRIAKELHSLSFKEIRSATEFILTEREPDKIATNWSRYREAEIALALLSLPLIMKPCCMLFTIAWLIPRIAAGLPAVRLAAYPASLLAELINEPTEPYRPHCTSIGNNWLHRLGVYLLHCCELQDVPPPMELTRLLSLISTSKAKSTKAPRAGRLHEMLVTQPQPIYLHESPAPVAMGYMLALELLGQIDANRQVEHFRRIERAVAHHAMTRWYSDTSPSIKSTQDASGLSWADSRQLVGQWFFGKLVFEYQCRFLGVQSHLENCPECKSFRESAQKRGGKRLPSSLSQ